MKVCHLTSVHPYNDARIFHKECASLAAAGFDVTLIAPVDSPFEEKGVAVIPAGSWSTRTERTMRTLPRLLRLALGIRADIYHLHDPELLSLVPLLRRTGAAVVYDIHEDYVTAIPQKSYIPPALGKPLAKMAGSLESFFAARCHQIIAEKYYRERFPGATEVLNYPLPPGDLGEEGLTDCSQFDPRWDWLLYTGNVTVDRGALNHLRCLEVADHTALAYVGRCHPGTAADIFTEAERKSIPRHRIRIIGIDTFVPPDTIAGYTRRGNWLAGLALFPATLHYEKKELTKFFEYMAAGLPVLASDFPAWIPVIEGNQCGMCLPPEDPVRLRAAITRLQGDAELAREMGRRGRVTVSQKYRWENEADKLVKLYRSIYEAK